MYDQPRARRTTGYDTCDDCNRRVLYVLTEKHRRIIAVDPPADPSGNQAVYVRDTVYWARQLTKDRPRAEDREVLRMPHIATCPTAIAARARARAATRRRTTSRTNTGVRPNPTWWRR